MKTLQRIIALAIVVITFSAPVAQAGEVAEWLKAAAFVYVRHEIGHQDRVESQGVSMNWSYQGGGFIPDYDVSLNPLLPNAEKNTMTSVNELIALNKTSSPVAFETDYNLLKQRYVLSNKIAAEWAQDRKENSINQAIINQKNIPIIINNHKKLGAIAGGGFVTQQEAVENLPDGDFKTKAVILSAALKGGYVGYHYMYSTGTTRPMTGDIIKMTLVAPASLTSTALVISTITDLWRASKPVMPNWRIDFLSDPHSGAVGLAYAGRF